MPKQIITSPDAPTTGFTDKATPSPLAQAIRAGMAGEKVTRTCIGATPHRKGVNVEIDCVASFD
jgi:hypothetical protein